MLVYANGEQTGTLGGGCVEAEVKRNAMRVIGSGVPELTTFTLDHDYGWDDGLICGGRMTVLLEPLTSEESRRYFQHLVNLAESGKGFTEAVSFDAEKSGLPCPASLLFDGRGKPNGALHVDNESASLCDGLLRPLDSRPRPYAESGIAFLPFLERCRLIIVGGGHIGQAVAALTADLDFDVWVTDDRESYISEARFPTVARRIAGPCTETLPSLELNSDTYCLIVTRGHNHDKEALYHLADRGARYVGMIGSQRKIRLIFDDLKEEGVSEAALANVFAPVGIDIGSQTVPEIAISIAAELIAHRNRSGVIPGKQEALVVQDVQK